ncbi:hypothetical protein [Intrasporangium sp. DVR]|uniref:hypothetical protein n=1 Tax=Intrasporangium sp. DVR TaxID=3127867 RepID=UPI00333EEB4D
MEIRLATFDPHAGYTLASPGYPPTPRPNEHDQTALGAAPPACTDKATASEIQIGMTRSATAAGGGGGWDGTVVEYTLSGTKLSLEIPYGMLLCGTSTDPC